MFWLLAAQQKIAMQIERVPSELNIADLPSREEYHALHEIGANWVGPCLEEAFWHPESWASLSLKKSQALGRNDDDKVVLRV